MHQALTLTICNLENPIPIYFASAKATVILEVPKRVHRPHHYRPTPASMDSLVAGDLFDAMIGLHIISNAVVARTSNHQALVIKPGILQGPRPSYEIYYNEESGTTSVTWPASHPRSIRAFPVLKAALLPTPLLWSSSSATPIPIPSTSFLDSISSPPKPDLVATGPGPPSNAPPLLYPSKTKVLLIPLAIVSPSSPRVALPTVLPNLLASPAMFGPEAPVIQNSNHRNLAPTSSAPATPRRPGLNRSLTGPSTRLIETKEKKRKSDRPHQARKEDSESMHGR